MFSLISAFVDLSTFQWVIGIFATIFLALLAGIASYCANQIDTLSERIDGFNNQISEIKE